VAKGELADPGGRYAVEFVSGGTLGGSLHKNMAAALKEGDAKGWHPVHMHGGGSAQIYIVWDKQGRS
jgi:hypothetical protein